jgi:hypothetical protein
MNRINTSSVSWGKNVANAALGNLNAYLFAAVLIACSVTVGCSSEKPQPSTSHIQFPPAVAPSPAPASALVVQAENKPAPKKPVQRKRPATVNFADKTYGVTFEYPRRYAIETGDAATQLVAQNPIAMNFAQPGGVALAAVSLPETNYTNTDFSSAFFNVSVNKGVTADQCSEFSVPAPKPMMSEAKPAETQPSTEPSKEGKDGKDAKDAEEVAKDSPPAVTTTGTDKSATTDAKSIAPADPNKLLIGDMELRATEAVSGQGTRQSDSKFFHVYQNGACYEFALNVTTDASEEGLVKHVDRDKVFTRLQEILSTVKINPVTPEIAAEVPTPTPQETPAQ